MDPIGERGGLNLYGFVGNDGVNAWDVLGLASNSLIDWAAREHNAPESAVRDQPDFWSDKKERSKRGGDPGPGQRDFNQQQAQDHNNTGNNRAILNVHALSTGGSGQSAPMCHSFPGGDRSFAQFGDQQNQRLSSPKVFRRLGARYRCDTKVWECRRRLWNSLLNRFRGKDTYTGTTSPTNVGYYCHVCEDGEEEYRYVRKSAGM
ncbi:MAG: hypothetical protein JJT75_07830 [Opitutales bacterium]|nr:hypothetical protein [Opitutales bacterium]